MQDRRVLDDAPDGATDRRRFLKGSMVLGAGVLAAGTLGPDKVVAQQAAPAAAVPPKLTYAQVMTKAREVL